MSGKGAAEVHTPAPNSGGPPSSGGMPQLDKYELLEEIGHGGMATVYRARDPRLGREVAVKVIHKHLRESREVGTRFVAEARAAAKLRHPNIVEVFDVSTEEDPERFLVVELLRGTTLRKILQQHRDMPAEIGACIVLDICAALENAHESGIIHRDIKPENVLVELPGDRAAASGRNKGPASGGEAGEISTPVPGEAGRSSSDEVSSRPSGSGRRGKRGKGHDPGVVIKITDFGIAKILDAQGVTSTGQVLGSPAHMAPEQIEGGEVDARTDVFAVGVLMYECLVGHLPFEGKNPAQVLRKVLDGIYPPADRERASVGGRWSKILAGALARDAAQRTATPAALAEQIRAELEALGIVDPPAEVTAYFADPTGHAADLAARLVPRLVARGEAARKAGDVPGAAADFNRALALAPSDLSILKRITTLNTSASRRQLARRLGAIALAAVVVGMLTAQIARMVKASAAGQPQPSATPSIVADTPSAHPSATASASAPAVVSAAPVDAARPKPTSTTAAVTPGPSTTTTVQPVAPSARKVRIRRNPPGARVVVDGVERNSTPFELSVGNHTIEISIQSPCCISPKSTFFEVSPPDPSKPDEAQIVQASLEMNPAEVTLVGAPAGGSAGCSMFALNPGSTIKVKMVAAEATTPCTFTAPDREAKQKTFTIKAGEPNTIAWPSQ